MPYRFFIVPIQDDGTAGAELNTFISNHKILASERHFVEQGSASFWSFCLDYVHLLEPPKSEAASKDRVDYKAILPPEDFAVYAQLRDWRKEISQKEGIPLYAVFTNEQLAKLVQQRVTTLDAVAKIEGVGEGRTQKFGERVLEVLNQAGKQTPQTNGKSV